MLCRRWRDAPEKGRVKSRFPPTGAESGVFLDNQ
jgi:hypothetical protein